MSTDDLSPRQTLIIDRVHKSEASIEELADVFPDPRDAFICSPVPISMRQLSLMYLESVPEDERHMLPVRLRERSRMERWIEQRAVYQTKRLSTRREAILNAEAEVWAVFGLEFHSRRIRGMWERWEALSAYVQDNLDRCERGEGVFTPALRDSCRELNDLERQLSEIMPVLTIPTKAQEYWTTKSGDRTQLISRIEERMRIAVGSSTAEHVFEVIDGGSKE
jgi:hypothetical protein